MLIHKLRTELERLHRGLVHPVLMSFQYHSIHTAFLCNLHHLRQVHITVSKFHTVRFENLSSRSAHPCSSVIDVVELHPLSQTSVYKGYKQDKIEMRGDRAEMSDFPLYLNTVAGGLDRRDQTIGGFSFVVKIYAVPVVEIIG